MSFVILDEPLSGIDPDARYSLKRLLKWERESRRTIFYRPLMLVDAEEICGHFAILHQRKIAFDGIPDEWIQHFQVDTLEQAYRCCISHPASETISALSVYGS
jgi:ABC-2 type transport system ATP-binding protein